MKEKEGERPQFLLHERWNCSRAPDYDKLPPVSVSMFASLTHLLFRSNTFFPVDSFFSFILSAHLLLLFVANSFFRRSFVPFIRLFGCHNVLPFASRLWIICLFVCSFVCVLQPFLYVWEYVCVCMYLSKKSVMLFVIFRWSAAGFAFGLGDGGKMSMCVKWPDCLNVRTHTQRKFLWTLNSFGQSMEHEQVNEIEWVREKMEGGW